MFKYEGDDWVRCKKLRFRGDSDGISCVRNVMEVSDKVTAVSDTAQTFTSVETVQRQFFSVDFTYICGTYNGSFTNKLLSKAEY